MKKQPKGVQYNSFFVKSDEREDDWEEDLEIFIDLYDYEERDGGIIVIRKI